MQLTAPPQTRARTGNLAPMVSELERAATAYVSARLRLEGADGAGLMAAAVDVDAAWHALHRAAGVEQCGEDLAELERDARAIVDTREL